MKEMFFYIIKGLSLTGKLYISTIILSLIFGIGLALAQQNNSKIIKRVVSIYVWIFRGSPLLLQLFFIYYGLPVFGITLSPITASVLAFTLNYSAYNCEIFRGGILSIDKGQYEAAYVLGFGYWQTIIKIIIPQSIRISLPALSNEAIALLKDTALVSAIGMGEILRNSKEIVTREFSILPFIICGVIYLTLSSVISAIFNQLEKRMEV